MYVRPALPPGIGARLRDGFSAPSDDAYGRVSDPRRYEPVIAVADALITALETDGARVDVAAEPSAELGRTQKDIVRAVQVGTRKGVDLLFVFTAFPGVILQIDGEQSAYPFCGCDACDQSALDAIEKLENAVLPYASSTSST